MKTKNDEILPRNGIRITFWKKLGCFLIGFCPIDLIQNIVKERNYHGTIQVLSDIYEKQLRGETLDQFEEIMKMDILKTASLEHEKYQLYTKSLLNLSLNGRM